VNVPPPPPVVAPVMANQEVNAILSQLLAGSGQPAFQPSVAPLPNADLAALLQTLGQPAAVPPVQSNIDISALLLQLQPQPIQQQGWASPPSSTAVPSRRGEERHRESERERGKGKRDRDPATRIKATRSDDIRESVRNSSSDQNMYRALCQFYVLSLIAPILNVKY
jgi:hypothetical protein